MKYKIGELAKIFNITKEGIRYYEKAEILEPVRDEENGYRYYSLFDFQKLAAVKKFQNINFSLEEIKDVYSSQKEDLLKIYERKLKEIKNEVYIKEKITEIVTEQIEIIKNVEELVKNYKIIEKKEFYRYNFIDLNELINSKHINEVSSWFKNMLLINASSKLSVVDNKVSLESKGLIVEKEIGDKLSINLDNNVEIIHKNMYLYTVIKIVDGDFQLDYLNKMIEEYKNKTNNQIRTGFTRVAFSYVNEENIPIVYTEVFLSIIKE